MVQLFGQSGHPCLRDDVSQQWVKIWHVHLIMEELPCMTVKT